MNIKFFIIHKSPYVILVISVIFFGSAHIVLSEDSKFVACAPVSCGQGPNISYPFWISNLQESYCGHPNFEIFCSDAYPILHISDDNYVIKNISFNNNSILLVNTMLYDYENTCPIPLRNFSLSNTPFDYSLGYDNLYFLYNCSSYPSDPTYKIDCASDSSHVSFAVFHPEIFKHENYSISSCQPCVNAPVEVEDMDTLINSNFTDILRNGFVLDWNDSNCSSCKGSGGRCGWDNNGFTCFCPDRPHSRTCNDGKNSTVGRNIGIGVCSIIGLFLPIIVFWCFHKLVSKEISKRREKKFFKQNGGLLLQQQLSSSDCNLKKLKVFKSCELQNATNHYNEDRVLGQGGQGTIYKGILPDGRLIAVKKTKIVDPSNVGQFINEVVILLQINHRNIVKLLGCCLETEVPMLVYEFISNGTLFQHIQNPKEEFWFNWEMRLRIAAEIAGTLSYLHNAAPVPIYHRDIKSTNILLDDKYQAKVSDFGISRSVNIDISHLTTLVRGTFGYLDPEYYQSSQFTEKSDVYSFGVVLVELLTGRKPIFSDTSQEFKKGLAPHFMESMEENHFLDMIDPQLSKEDKIEEMVEVAHLAKACLNSIGKRRPTMKEVTVQLEGIRMSREQTMSRENGRIDHGKAYDSSTLTEVWSESSANSSLNVDMSFEIK